MAHPFANWRDYNHIRNLQNFIYPSGVTYDELNRLRNLDVSCGTGFPACGPASQNLSAKYAYTLGPSGNRTGITELTGRKVTYGYDDLYRLTSETIACVAGSSCASQLGNIGYTYDAVGNRTAMTSTVPNLTPSGLLNYDANDRQTTDANETYDANGNTASPAAVANVYDFDNKLVQRGTIAIVYDGDGNRVRKTTGGLTTKYLVDTNNLTGYAQVLDETQSGTVVRKYTYGLDLIAQTQSLGTSFYGYDGHGSVRQLTDTAGNVTDTYTYDAFGNLLERTGNTPNLYLYAGEQFDPDLGLYYNRARYLDVRQGRFWGMDTFEGKEKSPSSLHKYLYASNHPIDRVDPSGNFDLASTLGVAMVAVTIFALSTVLTTPVVNNAEVEIHFDKIEALESAHHAYILLKREDGLPFVFRGGPSLQGGGSSAAISDFSRVVPDKLDLGFGVITSSGSGQPFVPGAVDYPTKPGDDVASVKVPDVTKKPFELYQEFIRSAQQIDSLQIPYHPATQNSNSFAHTLLQKSGLNVPSLPVWTPGWDHILF